MAIAKTMVLTTLALAVLAFTAVSAKADTYHHIDELAVQVQAQSRELIKEVGLHYRHKAGYYHLRSDAIQLYRVAAHIHLVAHQHGSIHHLADDLKRADQLFHHLECVLEQTDSSFGGHSHGATHHVFEIMHVLEDSLHHLKEDVDSLDAAAHHNVGRHGRGHYDYGHQGSRHQVSNHNVNRHSRSGISYNRNGWTFRFGF